MIHEKNVISFKGIKFYNTSFENICIKLRKGGYLVAPAASALSKINKNLDYYNSLKKADVAILDSGFFCILLRLFKRYKVRKLSGYLFLKKFLNLKFSKKDRFLLIDPTRADSKFNRIYLKKKKLLNVVSYVAPKYDTIQDSKLLILIKKTKPKFILINLGGEVQEILALYIKKNIKFNVTIFCTGAAIAFLTKRQAPINDFIDKIYLGWFIRLLYNPRKYFKRILGSFKLIKFFL